MTTKEKLEEIYIASPTFTQGLIDVYNLAIQDAADEAETEYDMANVKRESITKLMIK